MVRSLKNMDEANRKLMITVLRLLLHSAKNNVSILLPHRSGRRMEPKMGEKELNVTEEETITGLEEESPTEEN